MTSPVVISGDPIIVWGVISIAFMLFILLTLKVTTWLSSKKPAWKRQAKAHQTEKAEKELLS